MLQKTCPTFSKKNNTHYNRPLSLQLTSFGAQLKICFLEGHEDEKTGFGLQREKKTRTRIQKQRTGTQVRLVTVQKSIIYIFRGFPTFMSKNPFAVDSAK